MIPGGLACNIPIYWHSVFEAARQGHFVSIFQFTAKCYTPRNGGHTNRVPMQFFLDIINGSISLDIGI